MIRNPAEAKAEADLEDYAVRAGIDTGRWRILAFAFPLLDFVVAATEPDSARSEYGFRAELTGYPAQAPMVRIWDFVTGGPLAAAARPKGGVRVQRSFQFWQKDTVYRAWDRLTGPHVNGAVTAPLFAWHAGRRLSFVLEDLHAILNANARAGAVRVPA